MPFHHCQVEIEVQVPYMASTEIEGSLLVTARREWKLEIATGSPLQGRRAVTADGDESLSFLPGLSHTILMGYWGTSLQPHKVICWPLCLDSVDMGGDKFVSVVFG